MPLASPRTSPRSTHHPARLVFAALSLVVLTSGCVGRHDPTSYGDNVRKDFVSGCLQGYAKPGDASTDAASHTAMCGCLYDQISDPKTGISFDAFKNAQAKIREDPKNPANAVNRLIPDFDTYLKTCKGKTVSGPIG